MDDLYGEQIHLEIQEMFGYPLKRLSKDHSHSGPVGLERESATMFQTPAICIAERCQDLRLARDKMALST